MSEQAYPMLLSIYKGEGRILVVPVINHVAGYSINSGWFQNIQDLEGFADIGKSIIASIDFVKNSPLSKLTPKERELDEAWKKNSKYKSWVSFWKNNYFVRLKYLEDGQYEIYAMQRSEKRSGAYAECIKRINLSQGATEEEIGRAVMDGFEAVQEYYKDKPKQALNANKLIKLFDGSGLTVNPPKDKHFQDVGDCNAAELYQCYRYITQEGAESSADFFVGCASELDCNLEKQNVQTSWEEIYGVAEYFEMQETDDGIFQLRAEMRNKDTHKISYFLELEKDLILECGMMLYMPNKRKKLDESLDQLFTEFVLSCKRS